jgi:hypothetical protein
VEVIQQIGSYAGFAAVVGLAVLSALYFSQARDLRRLREWAGRAPDRPGPARAAADPRGSPTAPDREAQASPVAAAGGVVAGQATAAGSARPVEAGGPATATALSGAPASQPGASAPAAVPTGPPAPLSVAGAGPSPARPSPSRLAPNGKSAAAALGRPAPARDAGGPRRSPERSVSLRYVVLAVVGALIVIAAGTFAVGLVGGREEPAPPERTGATGEAPQQGAPGTPSSVTFSVLNGTGVDGVAKQVADELEAAGYRRGNVTNASEQKAESVVLYARTARADALAVAREIDVSQTEPIDAPSQALAGDASVVVVVGADQTQ